MALKGDVTVQLIDSSTGDVVNEIVSSNIVTNAASNIINGFNNKLGLYYNKINLSSAIFNNITDNDYSVFEQLFGGVLIFSKSIVENKSHIIPTVDEMSSFVGNASCDSSIESISPYRGTYNKDESNSLKTSDSISFVFDFDESCCNGEISSICLTSRLGGITGYNIENYSNLNEYSSAIKYVSDDNVWGTDFSFPTTTELGSARALIIDGFEYAFTTYLESTNQVLYAGVDKNDKTTTKLYKIDLDSVSKFSDDNIYIYDKRSDATKLAENSEYIMDCVNRDFCITLHGDYLYNVLDNTSYSFKIRKYSITGDTEDINIDVSNLYSDISNFMSEHGQTLASNLYTNDIWTKRAFIDETMILIASAIDSSDSKTYQRLYKVKFDGSFEYIDYNSDDGSIYATTDLLRLNCGLLYNSGDEIKHIGVCYFDGDIFLSSYNYFVNDNRFYKQLYRVTPGKSFSKFMFPFMINAYVPSMTSYNIDYCFRTLRRSNLYKEPFIECDTIFGGYNYRYQGSVSRGAIGDCLFITPYLATINNLPSVLTKTSNDKMKITYKLTQI